MVSSSQQDQEPFVTLSGKPSRRPLSWRGWKTRAWIKLLFGTISQPLTASLGVEKWIRSLPDSPVSQSVTREIERGKTIKDGSGLTSCESFARLDRDSSSWKTCQESFLWEPEPYSEALPKWGSMRNGALYQREALELRTKEKDGFAWPTPSASVSNDGESPKTWMERWRYHAEKEQGATRAGVPLTVAAQLWPTPQARDWRGANGPVHQSKDRPHQDQLPNFVMWSFLQGHRTEKDGQPSLNDSQRLSPQFVEMLMGLPIGWTGFERLETASCHYRRRLRFAYCGLGLSVDIGSRAKGA